MNDTTARPCTGHRSDPKNPGTCILCGQPCESRPRRNIRPGVDSPSQVGNAIALLAAHGSTVARVLQAVQSGASLEVKGSLLEPEATRRVRGWLESDSGARCVRAQGANVLDVLEGLAEQWGEQMSARDIERLAQCEHPYPDKYSFGRWCNICGAIKFQEEADWTLPHWRDRLVKHVK